MPSFRTRAAKENSEETSKRSRDLGSGGMGASQQTSSGGAIVEREQYLQPKLFRKFQLQKSTCMGLVIPQNLQLEIRNVDIKDNDIGPAYRTNVVRWAAQTVHLPPPFQIYTSQDQSVGMHAIEAGDPLVEVLPPRLNYLTKTIATVRLHERGEKLHFENDLGENDLGEDDHPFQDWLLKFAGWDRHINLISPSGDIFTWKNSKHITRLLDDTGPQCHGNLKLETADGRLLAAWKQRRDSKIMGSIHIFEESQHLLPIEMIVTSAVCMALQQKCSGMTYFVG